MYGPLMEVELVEMEKVEEEVVVELEEPLKELKVVVVVEVEEVVVVMEVVEVELVEVVVEGILPWVEPGGSELSSWADCLLVRRGGRRGTQEGFVSGLGPFGAP